MSSGIDRPEKTGRGGRATLLDVGRLAGVSGKTVSRVINKDVAIRPSTRERVEDAIAALGFRPNFAARSLRSTRSFNICLLTAEFNSSFYFSEAVRGAARACSSCDHHLVIEEYAPEPSGASLNGLLDRLKVDGFILLPRLSNAPLLLDTLDRLATPYVRLAPAGAGDRSPSVWADDAAGVRALARHFWALGHRRFAHIAGPERNAATHIRRQSFTQALVEAGADPADIIDFPVPEQMMPDIGSRPSLIAEAGRRAMDAMISLSDRPTAVFAFCDELAAGALSQAQHRGFSVPGDFAIAGFDDSEIARLVHPPLTTIRQPIVEMMEDAVRRLVDRRDSPEAPPHPVELLLRASTDHRRP